MRYVSDGTTLHARAIAGSYVVILAWDFAPQARSAKSKGLMGFAVERTEFKDGQIYEKYWMRSIKRFRDKDRGLAPGTPMSTADHPIQAFQWGDYTAQSGRTYKYRIVPVYGSPKNLVLDETSGVTLDVTTEVEFLLHPNFENDTAKHDVYFNRGVIGSQAYARQFGNSDPRSADPTTDEMKWLSRGLFEALQKFITLAEDHHFGLRAALYEFHYQPVANAFAKAHDAGADVMIVYDAESNYKIENERTIANADLDKNKLVIPRTVTEGIRHNKFVVLLKDEKPIAVWTGSTNISAGGIFGHSNVGHIVWDEGIAASYLNYWQRLADNLTPTKMRPLNLAQSPLPAGRPADHTVTPVFSARDAKNQSTSLQWYADRMSEAKRIVCFTVAFNIDKVFQKVLSADSDVLRYVVKDDDLGDGEIIGRDRDVLFAAGGYFGQSALANFLAERSNPLNTNDYIHNKFLLVDPLSDNPLVVTGSANFSQPSQRINDENMLVITSDTRVADMYFGEFMRIFDHHYARYLVKKLTQEDKHDPNAGYLKTEPSAWIESHFDQRSYKSKRRRYFMEVKGTSIHTDAARAANELMAVSSRRPTRKRVAKRKSAKRKKVH